MERGNFNWSSPNNMCVCGLWYNTSSTLLCQSPIFIHPSAILTAYLIQCHGGAGAYFTFYCGTSGCTSHVDSLFALRLLWNVFLSFKALDLDTNKRFPLCKLKNNGFPVHRSKVACTIMHWMIKQLKKSAVWTFLSLAHGQFGCAIRKSVLINGIRWCYHSALTHKISIEWNLFSLVCYLTTTRSASSCFKNERLLI